MNTRTNPHLHRGLRSAAELAAGKPCGTRIRYIAGCRCDACRAANTAYEHARALARIRGDWNGIVSAARARRHLLKLSRRGVGRESVCAATDLPRSTVFDISTGRKRRIRARTERRILAVDESCAADSALVCAKGTWRKIRALQTEGYTKAAIARRLGYASALQLNPDRITVRNRARVARLFVELMGEGACT